MAYLHDISPVIHVPAMIFVDFFAVKTDVIFFKKFFKLLFCAWKAKSLVPFYILTPGCSRGKKKPGARLHRVGFPYIIS